MWEGFNKRKFPRLDLECQIAINPEMGQKSIMARTENVGLGGVCVIQNQPLNRFSHCHIRLELDKSMAPIQCEGKISWIIPRRDLFSSNKRFDTGIEFVNLNAEDKDRLNTFIQERLPKNFKDIN